MQPNDKALYVILKSPHSIRPTQLALHVQLWEGTDGYPETLCFHDTNRGHMIQGETVGTDEHSLRFKDRDGEEWELREVTIQEFRHRLAKHVSDGDEIAKTIKSTEDLWEFYRKTFPL